MVVCISRVYCILLTQFSVENGNGEKGDDNEGCQIKDHLNDKKATQRALFFVLIPKDKQDRLKTI